MISPCRDLERFSALEEEMKMEALAGSASSSALGSPATLG